jgi:hypothetical protein
MFTALNPVEFAEVMSVGRHIPSAFESKSNLEKALSLDAAGDRYKAQGKFESAKFAYARALEYAIKAGI